MSDPTTVVELPVDGALPLFVHPEWRERFPWLVQGVTGRGGSESAGDPFDLRLFGPAPSVRVQERWSALREATGATTVVHSRQLHGTTVLVHEDPAPGLLVAPSADGHCTKTPGILLTVALADCVPVYLVNPERRAVALVHAGWRGVAQGILAGALEAMEARLAAPPPGTHVHLGPAICGDCYQVGPEVHEALGLDRPPAATPVDLRAVLAGQAASAGVDEERMTISGHCTLCGGSPFFSHRGGDQGRQVAYLGIRG